MFGMIAADDNIEENTAVTSPVDVRHRVLFISSYNPLYYSYDAQIRGLKEGLYPNGVEYDISYLDSINYSEAGDVTAFYEFIKSRMGGKRDYEAVITGDDDALRFALDYKMSLFHDVPVVFFGINDLNLATIAQKHRDFTGFYEKNYLGETIELATRLCPERKKIVGLLDNSTAGLADSQLFYNLRLSYPGYEFSEINTSELDHDGIIAALEALPEDSMLIYMTAYIDKDGNTYSVESRTDIVKAHTHVPVFRNYTGGEGMGVLGGVHMDFEAQCREAGQLTSDILEGKKDISAQELNSSTPGFVQFDYDLMGKYNLDTNLLPEGTIFNNKPESFTERYGRILAPVGFITAALLLLIISSQLNVRSARITNAELLRTKDDLELSKEEMQYLAEHDDLIGLINRRTARERLKTELTPEGDYSVIMADIDCFKSVNESYGHQTTDAVLKHFGYALKELADRNGWFVARYGGDEFLIMIRERDIGVMHPYITELLELFSRGVPARGENLELSASIGISNSDGKTTPEQHIINSENAMYEAKKRGGNGAFLFDEAMKEKQREEGRIKEKLQAAFDNDGFYMLYQPQVDSQTMSLSGFEALVRMKEPGIYPGQFIPVAEQNGWIWKIGRITTELVIKQLAKWRDDGYELHPVSVNFSSNQINDAGFIRFVEDLLIRYRIPPEYLEIEITEGIFLDRTSQAESLFQRFKELGIRLLMDDFGTGYSSLGYLTYIPVDVIKLDKSLVDSYLVDGKDSFIRDVIQLVHDLGKEMIIEGVEERWQYERLKEFGADAIQGYLFSKPISPEEAIVFEAKL